MPEPDSALVVIDVQNDFCPGGALAVPGGDAVVPLVNGLMPLFRYVVLTQDWHPADHLSFASAHPGRAAFETITADYGDQVLWPDHCIQGSAGAAFHPSLNTAPAALILRKGMNPKVDSYSAFFENDRRTPTGLTGWLTGLGIRHLYFCGVATDFCVLYSAIDGRRAGFDCSVIEDACRGIDLGGSMAAARGQMLASQIDQVLAASLRGARV